MKLIDILIEASPEEIHADHYQKIDAQMFDDAIKADPTTIVRDGKAVKLGKYSRWILKFVAKHAIHPKEYPELKKMLTIYNRTHPNGDIMRFKDLESLNQVVYGDDSKMDIVYDDGEWQVEVVHDFDSSCSIYGKKTDWCNARYQGNGRSIFKDYKNMGKAFVVRSKTKDSELYQVFFGDLSKDSWSDSDVPDLRWEFQPSFKAKKDTTPFFRDWLKQNPRLKKFFYKEGLTDEHKNIRTDAPEN